MAWTRRRGKKGVVAGFLMGLLSPVFADLKMDITSLASCVRQLDNCVVTVLITLITVVMMVVTTRGTGGKIHRIVH